MKAHLKSIQEQLDLIKESKFSKRSDYQLAHNEKLASWRNSEKNKNQFKKQGLVFSKVTLEQVQEIRDKFYKQNVRFSDLCKIYDLKHSSMEELLQNQSYKIETWNYPDYEKQRQYNVDMKKGVFEKIEFIKQGCGLRNFCEKFDCSSSVYYKLVKKYKIQTPGRWGNKRPKNFVEQGN